MLAELIGHITRQSHNILFAQAGMQHGTEFAWVFLIESVQIHGNLGGQTRLRRAQLKQRQFQRSAVHLHVTCQLCQLNTALFPEGTLAQGQREARSLIGQGIHPQMDAIQGKMIRI